MSAPRSRIRLVHGPRAAESALIAELTAYTPLARLGAPLRILVPSRSLRLHLGRRIALKLGAVLGLRIQTLPALAEEVLERAGQLAPGGASLVDVWARRLAAEEPACVEALGGLEDGYGTVLPALRDLLDAGLGAHMVDALLERAADDPEAARRSRTEALIRIAGLLAEKLEEADFGRPSTRLDRARLVLEQDPSALGPGRWLVYGFSSATGAVTELLLSLARLRPTLFLIDLPAAPASTNELERQHPAHLLERLALPEDDGSPAPEAPTPTVVVAPNRAAELRHLARAVRSLLDGGLEPEEIGIVARDLGPYVLPLRRELHAMGIPFSGDSTPGPLTPGARRAHALLAVLGRRHRCLVDSWLDAIGTFGGPERGEGPPSVVRSHADLRLGLRVCGAVYLEDVAALPDPTEDLRLPARRAASPLETEAEPDSRQERSDEGDDPELDDGPAPTRDRGESRGRRVLPKAHLAAAVSAARRICAWFSQHDGGRPLTSWFSALDTFFRDELGWRDDTPGAPPVRAALEAMVEVLPPHFELDARELEQVLHAELAEVDRRPLGGGGAGVAVLSVVEARSRTFSALYLVGLDRSAFPKVSREDPLLPDPVRRLLVTLLPDLQLTARALDEERYLFAQLLHAADAVTLSWTDIDDRGRLCPPSPFIERLLLQLGTPATRCATVFPGRWDSAGGSAARDALLDRPPEELPLLAGLFSTRERVSAALSSAWRLLPAPGPLPLLPEAVAAARIRVIDEADPDLSGPEGRERRLLPGPFQGYLGAPAGREPLVRDRWLTELEAMAGCAWQLFLERLLELRPIPEPGVELPGIDPALTGRMVHAVLERVVRDAFVQAGVPMPKNLAAAARSPVVQVPWPDPAQLERVLQAEAQKVLQIEGLNLPGFWRAFAPGIRERLHIAQQLDWADGPLGVLGVEAEGELPVQLPEREVIIRFRADRVDTGLRLTEYKSGRPREGRRPEKHREKLLSHMRSGQRLQAGAYALAPGAGGEGRYVHLHPKQPTIITISADEELEATFREVASTVTSAWDTGAFLPRVVDPSHRAEPARCDWCRVAPGCTRGDSTFRQRLVAWLEREPDEAETDASVSGHSLLKLGEK